MANFMDRPIHVYTCMNDSQQPAVALIDRFPMIFTAPTPMAAKRIAEEWRVQAIKDDKLLSKSMKAKMLGDAA